MSVFYFYITDSPDIDPRKIKESDRRLQPLEMDPHIPLIKAISTLQTVYITEMDFSTSYVLRLYVPKGDMLERRWLTLRKSLSEQEVTEFDYVVIYPLNLCLKTRQRSWGGALSGMLTKRSIKVKGGSSTSPRPVSPRKTGYKARYCIFVHNFLIYFEKKDDLSFPLGIFALDFYQVEMVKEVKRKKEVSVLRFNPKWAFGASDNTVYELSPPKGAQAGVLTEWFTQISFLLQDWHNE